MHFVKLFRSPGLFFLANQINLAFFVLIKTANLGYFCLNEPSEPSSMNFVAFTANLAKPS